MCAEVMGFRDCSYCLCQNLQPRILLLTIQIKTNKQPKTKPRAKYPSGVKAPCWPFPTSSSDSQAFMKPKGLWSKEFLKNRGTRRFDENYL